MVLLKMNNHEHRTKQTYESYTFQPLMSFWFYLSSSQVCVGGCCVLKLSVVYAGICKDDYGIDEPGST